jgi:hypothetical protein
VYNLWEIGENKQIRHGVTSLGKQAAQAATAVSRVNLQVGVLQSSFPQDKKTRTRKRQRLLRPGSAAHQECVQTEKMVYALLLLHCARDTPLSPGRPAVTV